MKYTGEWKGLDQGVEFTWTPAVIESVLREISKYGSFDYGQEDHPIWDELERQFPDKTWRSSVEEDFRPIFRRSNTWRQLGLVYVNKRVMTLTPLATDFLIGELSLEDIIIKACGTHSENNEHPFSVIASAFLEKPAETFSIKDIEVAISQNYRPGVDELGAALATARASTDEVEATRRRRIRSMMDKFVTVGAISGDAQSGWKLEDSDALIEIINASENVELAAILSEISIGDIVTEEVTEEEVEPKAKQKKSKSINKRAYDPNLGVAEFQKKIVATTNPQRKVELLEKATRCHADTLKKLASYIGTFGMSPSEDPDSYDLYGENDTHGSLFEVKSWTKSNIKDQIRKGIAQLYEYKWRASDEFKEDIGLYIVLDRDPTGFIDEWLPEYLAGDRGICLSWINNDGQLVSYDGIITFK